ncbi:hypothetical protein GWI33_021373 [Rhynchophorus ferrugineus]|uniref:Arf-GAP domain-containing protein n=1 Tax=Rhynchophorus ferrugineus TaxID=354439 RepID=A0A834HUR5_RHYFE|nr:hypothetical protein GWI33_021373 [Rhynchophorus ferrugineus]
MSLKGDKDKAKQLQDKCQSVLNTLLRDEDNKYCVDCDSKGPRWASWNIGVFLCIRCAGIHRNLGVHISKVKSVNLDSWTPEQVVSLQQMGNSRARAVYEANLPDNFRRPQNDSSLESFIRAKYEHKKYIAREWVAPALPKVNWEKEIEEEMEKQKRKKKNILEKKPLANVEVPQIPKPTNPSPKPARSSANTPETKEKQKHTTNSDLLGLQNGEDSFSNFISAATSQPVTPAVTETPLKIEETKTNLAAKTEEENFFNQTMPAEKEKVKLDKDSILALYGNGPTMPTSFIPFQNTMQYPASTGGFPAFGAFPQQSSQQGFSQNGMVPNQYVQPQTGFQNWNKTPNVTGFTPASQNAQFLQSQFAQPAPAPAFQNGQLSSQFGGPYGGMGVHQQVPLGQQFGSQSALGLQQQMPNAFFGSQQLNLQQQFGNLSLGGAAPAPANGPAPTLATNIWQ